MLPRQGLWHGRNGRCFRQFCIISGRITTDGTGAFFEFPQPVAATAGTGRVLQLSPVMAVVIFLLHHDVLSHLPAVRHDLRPDSGKYLHRLFLTV